MEGNPEGLPEEHALGSGDVRTTEIYTELAKAMRGEIASPLDDL